MKNFEEFSGKSSEERTTSKQEKKDTKGNRTRQKNKRGDSKVESNDSPEIPDRGETSDIPGLPSGVQDNKKSDKSYCRLRKSTCFVLASFALCLCERKKNQLWSSRRREICDLWHSPTREISKLSHYPHWVLALPNKKLFSDWISFQLSVNFSWSHLCVPVLILWFQFWIK